MLPGSILPVMFPVTRKNSGYPHEWKEGGSPKGTLPLYLLDPSNVRAACASLPKPRDCFQICEPKVWLYLFWTHLHFPGCSFLHLSFQQKSHCLLSSLHRILSIFSQSNVGFYFLFFLSIQSPHHSPPTTILCICNKSVNFRNYLYFMGIHTLCQNDGPKVWRVISTLEFVSWWWMAVKPLWLLRLHCGWNNGGGHKSGSGEQRIKLLGRMAGSCRHDHLLTLKGFKNKWAETETILFGEAISCNVWQWSGHSWCVSSLMSPECPIKLGCYRPSATGTMLCMNDSPSTYWLPAWRKQLATLRFKRGWQYS